MSCYQILLIPAKMGCFHLKPVLKLADNHCALSEKRSDFIIYLFVEIIINVTAIIAIKIPTTIFVVSASPKKSVPTRIAVIGSNTPSTEALVAPILRVEMASVEVDTIVGKTAKPIRLPQAA